MLKPVPPHTAMLAREKYSGPPSRRSGCASPALSSRKRKGLTSGKYRKPHISAAMTPGIAYGRKIASRVKARSRTRSVSSSRANSRASPSITGTTIAPYPRMRSAPCNSSESESASV